MPRYCKEKIYADRLFSVSGPVVTLALGETKSGEGKMAVFWSITEVDFSIFSALSLSFSKLFVI